VELATIMNSVSGREHEGCAITRLPGSDEVNLAVSQTRPYVRKMSDCRWSWQLQLVDHRGQGGAKTFPFSECAKPCQHPIAAHSCSSLSNRRDLCVGDIHQYNPRCSDDVQLSEFQGVRTLSIVRNSKYNKTLFRKLDLFPSSGEGKERRLLCWVP
jgi:hypothetical protein